jgi:hypothetical protein
MRCRQWLIGMLSLVPVLAQPVASSAGDSPLTVIPYNPDGTSGNLITIPVSVNGGTPQWFSVDTGAPESVIDKRLADEMGLSSRSTTRISGTGAGTVPAGHVGTQKLTVGRISLHLSDPLILDLKGLPINQHDRGLVGSELFERYVVRLDPIHHTLAVFDPRTFRPNARDAVVPLSTDGRRLYLNATLLVRPGLKVVHRLRIDTGSEDTVDDPIVSRSRTIRSSTLGNGLGSNYAGVSGVYDAIEIGPYRFRHIWGPGSTRPAIGMEILRRFVLTFDVPHNRLYLRPTPALHDPVPAPGSA